MKRARPPIDLAQLTVGGASLLTTQDVARLLRIHPKHVYRLLRRGLPGHRVGGEWRFLAEEVLPWSATRSSTSAPSGRMVGTGATAPFSNVPPSLLAANGDIAVEYLLTRMAEGGGLSLGLLPADRGSGIERLRRGEVLATGCHGPEIPVAIDDQRLAFVHLVDRQVGLATRVGLKVRNLRQLRHRRIASRPPTAGVRARFDSELVRSGVDPDAVHQNAVLLASHCEVVCAVARGDAEVGLASRAWAHRVGLAFFPLCEETYGLLVPASQLGDPRVVRLCEVAQSASFRRAVGMIAGYDARHAGTIRFEPQERQRSAPSS